MKIAPVLELGEYMARDQLHGIQYKLYAVIEHYGETADSGHYSTYVKDANSDCDWYYINEETVQKRDELRVLSCQAYLLFYQKVH